MAIIEESVEVRCPVDKVFIYTIDPENYPMWQPFPEAEKTSPGPMGIGTTTKGKIHLMGLTMKWTAKVTEYEVNKKFFKNVNSGPVSIVQHNTYGPVDEGTKFTIMYDMKVGGIMKPFSSLVISSMRKELHKALNNVKGILEDRT